MLYKTGGSYVNRPFFRFRQDMRENVFFRQIICPAVSFVSFLQEKKTFPFFAPQPRRFLRFSFKYNRIFPYDNA